MAETFDSEYAKEKINQARLDESDIFPLVQALYIDDQEQDSLRLLQLNTELAKDLQEGKILTIRGEEGETAVICSESCTYEMREAETSNSLLIVPKLHWPNECDDTDTDKSISVPQEINGIFHTYFELRVFKPKFKKLRTLLEMNSYQGKEYETDNMNEKYTFEDLLDIVQSSEEELKAALSCLQTCNIDGYVRVLDFDYKFNVFNQIINLVDSKSIAIKEIPRDSVLEILEDLEPREILEQCFTWFTDDTGRVNENGEELFSLDENAVCSFFAEILLKSAGKFHLEEFLESWQKSVPEGMKCSLSQLEGIAITDLSCRPEVIFYFPVHDLPENITERFEKLFMTKPKWTYEEIFPYVKDRAFAGNDVKTLLIKYTRESTKDFVKVYSSKW